MPSPLRFLFPKTPVFITSRIEEGLPLIPAAFMNHILEGIIARAQYLYPVVICGFKFMSNHLHMLLMVDNPDDVVAFMDRIKTESGHAVNRLLGKKRHTVWQKSYDSPTVLTLENGIEKLIYLYTNAQTANLVATIDDYPNVSSWKMLTTGVYQKSCKWIQRPMIKELEKTEMTISEQESLGQELLNATKAEHTLTLQPDAWLAHFAITEAKEIAKYRQKVIDGIRAEESALAAKRTAEGKVVMGREKLLAQPIDTPYTPKKYSKRMWCICWDVDLRIKFIQFVKDLIDQARAVLKEWRAGNTAAKYPPGLFPPSMPKLCNILPPVFA